MDNPTDPTSNLQDPSNVSTLQKTDLAADNVPIEPSKTADDIPPVKPKNPNLLIKIGFVSVLLLAATSILLFQFSLKTRINNLDSAALSPTPFLFSAKVVYLSGSAWQLEDDRKVELKENDVLEEKDTIVTDAGTRLVLSLDEGSVIRIDENSQITLSQLTSALTSITQETGFVFFRVQKDENHRFVVQAGDVTVESLGTAYSVEKEDEVIVKVFEDTVKVLSEETETKVEKNEEWAESGQEVTQIDSKKLATNEFYQWSLKEEGLDETTSATAKPLLPTSLPQEKEFSEPTGQYIKLSGKAIEGGVKLSWKSVGIETTNGFKVVKGTFANPVYPGNDSVFVSRETPYYFWENLHDGETYHFRVCQYLDGGQCGAYSNDLAITASSSITIPEKETSSE